MRPGFDFGHRLSPVANLAPARLSPAPRRHGCLSLWARLRTKCRPSWNGFWGCRTLERNPAGEAALALATKAKEAPDTMEPWTGEPGTLDEMLDRYVVESKFSGRAPACTLYLVCAKTRSGDLHQALPSQKFKLFLAPWPQR